MDRWLTLEGLHNARDVGGLPVRSGGRTRRGVLLRSDEPVDCTPADVAQLHGAMGLRCVIDVGGTADRAADVALPLRAAGIEHLSLDLTDIGATPEEQEAARALVETGDEAAGLRWMADRYIARLDASGVRIVEMLGLLVEGRVPALIHCVAGKDRTGVAVAMLLGAADVEPDAIIADYALTEERIDPLMAAIRRRREMPAAVGGMAVLLSRAPAVVMADFLASVESRHGGPHQWFLDAGAPEDLLAEWTALIVER